MRPSAHIRKGISRLMDASDGETLQSQRDFIARLEMDHDLHRIRTEVNPRFEITEICHRTLKKGGPALLFENPSHSVPALGNLYGTTRRVAAALGLKELSELRRFGEQLAFLVTPDLPTGINDALDKLPSFRQLKHVNPRQVDTPPCREVVIEKDDIDLSSLPIPTASFLWLVVQTPSH